MPENEHDDATGPEPVREHLRILGGRPRTRELDAEAEARRLVQTYADVVLRVSYTYLRSTADAEDVCQEVLLKLLRRTEPFDSDEHEKAWVIRVAINACKDLLRSPARSRMGDLGEDDAFAAAHGLVCDPADAPDDEVLRAVQALPIEYREAVFLYYYEGNSIKEVAARTGATEGAVTKRLSRARAKLRTMLGGRHG